MPLGLFHGVRTYDVSPGRMATSRSICVKVHRSAAADDLAFDALTWARPSEQFARGLKQRVESGS
jgi:hypothetical protein